MRILNNYPDQNFDTGQLDKLIHECENAQTWQPYGKCIYDLKLSEKIFRELRQFPLNKTNDSEINPTIEDKNLILTMTNKAGNVMKKVDEVGEQILADNPLLGKAIDAAMTVAMIGAIVAAPVPVLCSIALTELVRYGYNEFVKEKMAQLPEGLHRFVVLLSKSSKMIYSFKFRYSVLC